MGRLTSPGPRILILTNQNLTLCKQKKKILRSQLGALSRELSNDQTADLHFLEGGVDSPPGPGVLGYYDGPYFSWYNWPPVLGSSKDAQSIREAYEMVDEVIEEDGPFDGVIGFSHGGALAHGLMVRHELQRPHDPPLFRCAIFFNSMPPLFRADKDDANGVAGPCIIYDKLALQNSVCGVLSLHVVGQKDFAYEHSMALYKGWEPNSAMLIVHERGHVIPSDVKTVRLIAKEIREMAARLMGV